jgi:hypothetical protein
MRYIDVYHLYAAAVIVGVAVVLAGCTVAGAIDRYRRSWLPVAPDPLEGTELWNEDAERVVDIEDVLPMRRPAA